MKKKIVYISGADSFSVKDIRVAFDEVRSTLGLDSDTILFGVPIDEATESAEVTPNESIENKIVSITPALDSVAVEEPIIEECVASKEETPVPESEPEIANSNVVEEEAPVVPIQSVLTSGTKKPRGKKKTAEKTVEKEETVIVEESVAKEETTKESVVVPQEDTVAEEVAPVTEEETISVQEVAIEKMITDEMPEEPAEKTLEELLESMTPLREDARPDATTEPVMENEIDATLENLASEFADTQAKIPTPKKTAGRSKIGKLKGIIPLPFSKKNKDDSGIMGDLFGWAGFAANDDDFTIPGFFTNAAGKK